MTIYITIPNFLWSKETLNIRLGKESISINNFLKLYKHKFLRKDLEKEVNNIKVKHYYFDFFTK